MRLSQYPFNQHMVVHFSKIRMQTELGPCMPLQPCMYSKYRKVDLQTFVIRFFWFHVISFREMTVLLPAEDSDREKTSHGRLLWRSWEFLGLFWRSRTEVTSHDAHPPITDVIELDIQEPPETINISFGPTMWAFPILIMFMDRVFCDFSFQFHLCQFEGKGSVYFILYAILAISSLEYNIITSNNSCRRCCGDGLIPENYMTTVRKHTCSK